MPRGVCLYDGCAAPARLYPGGWRCAEHGPPAQPPPPPGTTLAERLEAAGVRRMHTPAGGTVVDRRAVASGKRRSSPTAYRNARGG